jgi:predicted secreted hydrolase
MEGAENLPAYAVEGGMKEECAKPRREFLGRCLRRTVLLIAIPILVAVPAATWGDDGAWLHADQPRVWRFPRDHGAHPDYRTEWWYFTGILRDQNNKLYGYQLTFFRHGLTRSSGKRTNVWSVSDLFLAHFAITDVTGKRFFVDERVSRTGPGLAGASLDGMKVWILDWSIYEKNSTIYLKAKSVLTEIELRLVPRKPLVLHGNRGLSRKGDRPGQASYYVSYTDLETTGSLKLPGSPGALSIHGVSWFDHEFGSNQLTKEQIGWDWYSLHLSDGRDLMLYLLRRVDGTIEPASSGTVVGKTGTPHHIVLSDLQISVLERWRSPASGATYPSKWRIVIPSEAIDLSVAPMAADQELRTQASTGVTYWEGAVQGTGMSEGRPIVAEGYIELTGYAGKIGGLF